MTLRRNIAANIAGRVWSGAMGVLFVPLYIHWLGIEAFGLIGLSVTLLAVFAMLDLGLGTAINRQFAYRMADADADGQRDRDLLRSLEIIYWAMGVLIAAIVIAAAPLIAERWLSVGSLDLATTTRAIRLMGVSILFRWPVSLYTGALLGLQRHVALNAVTSLYATLQGAGVLLVFMLLRPGIDVFFVWQAIAALFQIMLLARLSWSTLGTGSRRPRFSPGALRAVLGFSAGVMGITLLSIALTQLDKVVLSRVLPLREFGYYALAGSVASVLNMAAIAINSAAFPALSQRVSAGGEAALAHLYHQSCQYLAVAIIPAGLALAIFAPDVLALYVSDPTVAARTHRVLSLLALGNMLLGLMVLPLTLQLAHGWTRLSLYKNLIAVVLFVPTLLTLVHLFGMAGAALTWLLLTLGYFVGEILAMHRRLLPGEQWRWYAQDTLLPIIVAGATLLVARLFFPDAASAIARIAYLGAAGALAVAATALALPATRQMLLSFRKVGRSIG